MQAQSEREFLPEGAIVMMDSLAGRKLADIIAQPERRRRRGEPLPAAVRVATGPRADPAGPRRGGRGRGAGRSRGRRRRAGRRRRHGHDPRCRLGRGAASCVAGTSSLPTARTARCGSASASGSTAAASSRTASRSTSPPTCGRRWRASPSASSTSTTPSFGGFFRLDKDCRSGFLVVNTVGEPGVAGAADAAVDTSEARLVELVRVGRRRARPGRADRRARPLAGDRRRGRALPAGPGLPGR